MGNQTQSIQPQMPVQPASQPTQSLEPKKFFPKWPLIIIGLVLIIIFGAGAYLLGKNQGVSQKSASETVQASTPTPDPTATWKTFTTQSGVSFKYPSDWIPKETVTPKDSSGFGPRDDVTLTSPNGLVIAYGDHINGLGGGCDPADCPNNHILKVEPVNIPVYGTLNLIELVIKDSNDTSVISATVGLIDPQTYPNLKVGTTKQFGYYVLFQDKDPKKYLDEFSVRIYDTYSKINKLGQSSDLNKYFSNPETVTAEKIIKTLKFTDQTTQDSSNSTLTNLNIPELNIRIALSDEIKDLAYFPKTNNGKTDIYLWTNSLANAGEKEKTNGVNYCASDQAPLGSFSKIYKANLTEDPNQPWWNRLSALRDATKERIDESGVKLPIVAKEFSDFFIFYRTPQQACSNNASISNMQSSSVKAIEKLIPTIDLIQ